MYKDSPDPLFIFRVGSRETIIGVIVAVMTWMVGIMPSDQLTLNIIDMLGMGS